MQNCSPSNHRVHLVAEVYLFPTCLGGRRGPTPVGDFSCSIVIDKSIFEVCLRPEGRQTISPGQNARVSISFTECEGAPDCCSVDKIFVLREAEPIGLGLIEESGMV